MLKYLNKLPKFGNGYITKMCKRKSKQSTTTTKPTNNIEQNCIIFKCVFDYIKCAKRFLIV